MGSPSSRAYGRFVVVSYLVPGATVPSHRDPSSGSATAHGGGAEPASLGCLVVLFVSLRDLQWRRRRFLIGVLAAGLVFALTLLMSGVSASFGNEIKNTVAAFNVDEWVVPSGVSGPFTSSRVFPASEAQKIAALPGVRGVAPVLLMRASVTINGVRGLNVVGIPPDGIVNPKLAGGHELRGSGDMIVDASLGLRVGSSIRALGHEFTVVGRTNGLTYFAGVPVAFVSLGDLQAGALNSAPLVTTVAIRGAIASPLAGYQVLSNAAVRVDLKRPISQATQTISFITVLLWIVAAGIIGSILYLQAIERSRDFAVFKATGVTTRTLLFGLAFQAIALALCAAIAAYVLSFLLTPAIAMAVAVPPSAYIVLPVVAVVVGLVSSLVALRRAVTIDPALAFGG
jgi:putative ABC transport system permease protein